MFNKKSGETNKAIFSVILVIIETCIAVLLRFDKPLRTKLRPLIDRDIIVCVRTYLPHYEFYITFAEEGVLLDHTMPDTSDDDEAFKEDVLISGSSFAVMQLALTGNAKVVDSMQFRGEDEVVELLKDCVQNIGVKSMVVDIIDHVKDYSPETKKEKSQVVKQFKKTISSQEEEIATLNASLDDKDYLVTHHKKQIKILYAMLSMLTVAVGALLIYLLSQ